MIGNYHMTLGELIFMNETFKMLLVSCRCYICEGYLSAHFRGLGGGGCLEYRLVYCHYFVERIKPYHFLNFKKSVLLHKCQDQFM